ncbi:uncharacterized protein ACBR49_002782 [Aulostomus maculatus]
MSDNRRDLPTWMSKTKQDVNEKEPLKNRRKRKAARLVFYCMNERELVEAAASVLTDGACEDVTLLYKHKVGAKAGDEPVKRMTRRKTSCSGRITKPMTAAVEPEPSEVLTYVSESDLDVTEAATLPYTESSPDQGCEGQRSIEDDSRPLINAGLHAEKQDVPGDEAKDKDDDEALQLVREIFFTR